MSTVGPELSPFRSTGPKEIMSLKDMRMKGAASPGGASLSSSFHDKKSATISNFANLPQHGQMNQEESIVDHEAPLALNRSIKPKKTEYKAKYRPFSAYVYITGNGFKKPKDLNGDEESRAKDWIHEVSERTQKALEFQRRSEFGHPICGVDHLEEIYNREASGPWMSHPKDRSIAALALASAQQRDYRNERRSESDSSNRSRRGVSVDRRGITRKASPSPCQYCICSPFWHSFLSSICYI